MKRSSQASEQISERTTDTKNNIKSKRTPKNISTLQGWADIIVKENILQNKEQ